MMLWYPSISYNHCRAMRRTLGIVWISNYNYTSTEMNYKLIKNEEFPCEICNYTTTIWNRKRENQWFSSFSGLLNLQGMHLHLSKANLLFYLGRRIWNSHNLFWKLHMQSPTQKSVEEKNIDVVLQRTDFSSWQIFWIITEWVIDN
jgi:hypothetical protein